MNRNQLTFFSFIYTSDAQYPDQNTLQKTAKKTQMLSIIYY